MLFVRQGLFAKRAGSIIALAAAFSLSSRLICSHEAMIFVRQVFLQKANTDRESIDANRMKNQPECCD
jgi:hypothetical protein